MIAIQRPRPHANNQHDKIFLELLPAIQRYANFFLRDLPRAQREEGLNESVAYALCAFRRLAKLGKGDLAYASPLARFGVARFRAGRRIGSKLSSTDAFAANVQCQRVFATSQVFDLLADDSLTPVADQVAFRLDLAAWLRMLSGRDRRLAMYLAMGNTAGEAAGLFKISRARVSQVRKKLQRSWYAFQGEAS
jgi:hypothetical protein